MDAINVQEEMLEEVQVSGHLALFTELRVDKSTIPEGVYCYALRHGDDDSFPVALDKNVCVNYFGSVLMTEEIELEKSQYATISGIQGTRCVWMNSSQSVRRIGFWSLFKMERLLPHF